MTVGLARSAYPARKSRHTALEPRGRYRVIAGVCSMRGDLGASDVCACARGIRRRSLQTSPGTRQFSRPHADVDYYANVIPAVVGKSLGPYTITALIGEGGMGTVYRAHDPRLGRDVAIKISKQQFTARFEREARAIAALNHPNICQIFDIGPDYIVIELVSGVPIKGPLSEEKAIEYAGQILDALDAAHRKGITHRDLKPANILVTKQGIKLLDFGLAKQSSVLNESDAMRTTGVTEQGQILGTLQYMAPEQLQGKEADARSDLFSFGCVLYEMLSGKQAFPGSSAASVLAAILEREPKPLETTPSLNRVIRRCLAKDSDERFQTARDLKASLEWAIEKRPAPSQFRSIRLWWITGVAGLALGILTGALLTRVRQPAARREVPLRLSLNPPEGARFMPVQLSSGGMSLSPDGGYAAYIASAGGKTGLWLHQLAGVPRPLSGTDGAGLPFWSPDSRSIGFFAEGKLHRIEITGGAPQVICEAPFGGGASWGTDDLIIFGQLNGGLSRVSAAGGTPTPLTRLDPASGEVAHVWPRIIAGGHFLYFLASEKPGFSGLYAAPIAKPLNRVRLFNSDSIPIFAPPNYLLWARGTTVVAQRFDPLTLQLAGEPESLGGFLTVHRLLPHISASETGLLLYDSTAGATQLTWIDRSGKSLGLAAEPDDSYQARLSPEGRRAALTRATEGNLGWNIWVRDWDRGFFSRITFNPGYHYYPVWSPDSLAILYGAGTPLNLYRAQTSGTGPEMRLTQSPNQQFPTDWSRDGALALYYELAPGTNRDLWVLALTGANRQPRPYLQTRFNEAQGRFSPEPRPRWVAYQSDETGQYEIYIRTFPDPRAKFQISTSGGRYPQWGRGGRELYYISPDSKVIAVSLKMGLDSLETASPQALFALPQLGYINDSPYQADAAGERFLVLAAPEKPALLNLIVNWPALLKKGQSGR
jgi:serine/threonine protein kinase/Tol biopolymer transport system component